MNHFIVKKFTIGILVIINFNRIDHCFSFLYLKKKIPIAEVGLSLNVIIYNVLAHSLIHHRRLFIFHISDYYN